MGAEAAGQATSAGNGRMMRQRWAAWQGKGAKGLERLGSRWPLLY
jgi:hypothetical protein